MIERDKDTGITWQEALAMCWHDLEDVPEIFAYDKDFICAFFAQCLCSDAWQQIPEEMKKEEQVIRQALSFDLVSLKEVKELGHIAEELALFAYSHNPHNFPELPDTYKENIVWVKEQLKEHGFLYMYLPDIYAEDLDMALIAAETYPETLVHATPLLQNNLHLAQICIEGSNHMISFIGPQLQDDLKLAVLAFHSQAAKHDLNDKDCLSIMTSIPEAMKDNLEIMQALMNINPVVFAQASEKIRGNYELINKALTYDMKQLSCRIAPMVKKRVVELSENPSTTILAIENGTYSPLLSVIRSIYLQEKLPHKDTTKTVKAKL